MTDVVKCSVCHREVKPEEMTMGAFLVAGKEETLPAHQRCIDRELARLDRFTRKMEKMQRQQERKSR